MYIHKERTMTCDDCNMKIKMEKQRWKEHIMSVHTKWTETCEKCNKLNLINNIISNHEENNTCKQCRKKVKENLEFNAHKDTKHKKIFKIM
jgi:hypothetical protein